jgi:hypothetical protein
MSEKRKSTPPTEIQMKIGGVQWIQEKNWTQEADLNKVYDFFYIFLNVMYARISARTICDNADRIIESAKSVTKAFVLLYYHINP